MTTSLTHGYIYTMIVTIDSSEFTFSGKYDKTINAIRNLKKSSLYCSLVGNEKVLGEWKNKAAYLAK